MPERSNAELIGQVLERLAQGRYTLHDDDGEEVIWIQNYGPTFEEMEDYFRDELLALHALQDCIEDHEPHNPFTAGPIEEHWCDFWTQEFLKSVFGANSEAPFYERLRGLSYEEVVSRTYDLIHEGVRKILGEAVFDRERLTPENRKSLAALLANGSPSVSEILANAYARRLAAQFPKMIRRAEKLQALTVGQVVSPKVQDYLAEASKCYIMGQRIASVLVCRSAIEFAVTDLLLKAGKDKEVEQLSRRDFANLIKLARSALSWELKTTLDHADALREKMNKAVHEFRLSDEECSDLYLHTRKVLKELYA